MLEAAECQVCTPTAKGARKPMRSGELPNHLLVTSLPERRDGGAQRKDLSLCYHELMKDVEDVSCRRICRSSRPTDKEAVGGRWGSGKSGNERVVGVSHRQMPVFQQKRAMLLRRR